MKVNIEELQIRRAKSYDEIITFEEKYRDSVQNLTKKSFSTNSKFPFHASRGITSVIHNDVVIAICMYDASHTIYNMCVMEEYRNNGICKLLLEECIELMKEICSYPKALIDSKNPYAQKVIESIGFINYIRRDGTNYYYKEL